MALFTIDWEGWHHALGINGGTSIEEPTNFILDILDKYGVKAIFFMLGDAIEEWPYLHKEILRRGHLQGWHGQHHYRNLDSHELIFRSPYWDTTPMPWPPSGGFFFRLMPYSYVKWAVEKTGMFWLHPHDVMKDHPKLKNPILNWKRNIGLKESRMKLDRLLSEIEFEDPNEYFYASAS